MSIGAGVIRYYAIPFTTGGITLRLDVSVGYITCYASDTFRNPGPGNYVWLINTRGYADGFIDPASQFGRMGTRYIYVALVGVDVLNTFELNSAIGNFSSLGKSKEYLQPVWRVYELSKAKQFVTSSNQSNPIIPWSNQSIMHRVDCIPWTLLLYNYSLYKWHFLSS